MNIAERTIPGARCLCAVLLLLCTGCAEEPVETFEPTEAATEYHFPTMLNGKVLSADGHSIELIQNEITDVEVGDLTENPDGTFTAVVSFAAGGMNRYQCEARVTYSVVSASINDGAGEILIHTVEELETLSVAPAD